MKKRVGLIIVLSLVLCITLSACGNTYVSKYSATTMVKSNTSNKATLSFGSFKGTYVMQLRNNDGGEVCINYEATLEHGNIKVYVDYNGEKLSLFDIGNTGSVKNKTESFIANKKIFIIIESNDKSLEGDFSFVLEKA